MVSFDAEVRWIAIYNMWIQTPGLTYAGRYLTNPQLFSFKLTHLKLSKCEINNAAKFSKAASYHAVPEGLSCRDTKNSLSLTSCPFLTGLVRKRQFKEYGGRRIVVDVAAVINNALLNLRAFLTFAGDRESSRCLKSCRIRWRHHHHHPSLYISHVTPKSVVKNLFEFFAGFFSA